MLFQAHSRHFRYGCCERLMPKVDDEDLKVEFEPRFGWSLPRIDCYGLGSCPARMECALCYFQGLKTMELRSGTESKIPSKMTDWAGVEFVVYSAGKARVLLGPSRLVYPTMQIVILIILAEKAYLADAQALLGVANRNPLHVLQDIPAMESKKPSQAAKLVGLQFDSLVDTHPTLLSLVNIQNRSQPEASRLPS